MLRQIRKNFTVCASVSLVHFHHARKDVSVFRFCKGSNCFFAWKRLKSKFTQVAEMMFSVFFKRFASVPYIPIMLIATVLRLRIVKVSAAGGRRRNIRNFRADFFDNIRNAVFIYCCIFRTVVIITVERFNFIITAY